MNRLSQETSPYLLQHAHNPVDWYPWGEEAFEKARREDKPILVSIGYATCHWCHVMERESFEDAQVARFMNDFFVCIKVDREERPDVDALYMEAVQVILQGGGGWPLNCFLLPDGRPFFGGTYFPPKQAYGRSSWVQVLSNITHAFTKRRSEVEEQAEKLMAYLKKSESFFLNKVEASTEGDWAGQYQWDLYYNLRENFDRHEGGFGTAPKFPSVMALRYCLYFYQHTAHEEALEQVLLSVHKMMRGGIYDQLGGGFARYAVDQAWLVPHFEKMLYDNALLLGLLAELHQRKPQAEYRRCVEQTLAWLKREMLSPEGLFYSALDADSEGVEGKYYVWSKAEVEALLGEKAALFCEVYDVTEEGNWEEVNILHLERSVAEYCRVKGLEVKQTQAQLEEAIELLLAERQKRIPPSLDDKSLLDWNALLLGNLVKVQKAMPDLNLKPLLDKAFGAVERCFIAEGELLHSYKAGRAKQLAFLDDYAYWIGALLEYYGLSWDVEILNKAKHWMDVAVNLFYDEQDGLFFFTRANSELVHRKKDLYDNATPSGNSVMLHNLQILYLVFGQEEYSAKAERMLGQMRESMQKFPQSFGHWATGSLGLGAGWQEIAIVGADYEKKAQKLLIEFHPQTWIMAALEAVEGFPLLENRGQQGKTLIYRCQNFTCQEPSED